MENELAPRDRIIDTFKRISCMKQDVFQKTTESFGQLHKVLKVMAEDFDEAMEIDSRVTFEYSSFSKYEARLKFAGDTLIFHMHTNVFKMDDSHPIWETSYVKKDTNRGYCGIINIYNFLSDSFKFNRVNDRGYLVARIFVNMDGHFVVEGKRQLGMLYNDFINSVLDPASLKGVIETTILYSLDFDLTTPPYENMKLVSLHQMMELSDNLKIATGKRLGFQFQADSSTVF